MIAINNIIEYKLKIADLYFEITSFPDNYTEQTLSSYSVEEIPHGESFYKVNCTITTDSLEEPPGEKLTIRQETNWYKVSDGVYNQSMYDAENDCICANVLFDNISKTASVVVKDMKGIYGVDTEVFLYNLLDRLFRLIVVFNGGFVFHASSVAYKERGIAFSAQSGVGKSTHTGLWLENKEGTYIINDDAPVLRFTDGKWYIYGSPWAGTTGINANVKLPFEALVFLERNSDNVITDCPVSSGIKRVFEAIMHPVSDEITDILFYLVSHLFTDSRVCILGCNISEDAVNTVEKYLFK